LLLRLRFRVLFGHGGEVDSGEESADKHDQQIDFHVFLRCLVQLTPAAMEVMFQRTATTVTPEEIKIGKFCGKPMETI
jgi:hypothetical protein